VEGGKNSKADIIFGTYEKLNKMCIIFV